MRGLCDGHCQYHAGSLRIWSAIMGARWADLMGFRAGPMFSAQQRCLLAVAQDNEDVQYDHALRRKTDVGPFGGAAAMRAIDERLTTRFTEAVLAGDDDIPIADGGAKQDHYRAVRSFFLFGRALHIVQDSFSKFHAQRGGLGYREWRQVNSYVCTPHSPVHPHLTPGVKDLFFTDAANGDIIWKDGCDDRTAKCLKAEYVAAVEASRDLWSAFWRCHRLPADQRSRAAKEEIGAFVSTWMKAPETVLDSTESGECAVDEFCESCRRERDACLAKTGAQPDRLEPPSDWNRKNFGDIQ